MLVYYRMHLYTDTLFFNYPGQTPEIGKIIRAMVISVQGLDGT